MNQLRIRAARRVMRARSIPLDVAGSVLRLLRRANEVRGLALTTVGGGPTSGGSRRAPSE